MNATSALHLSAVRLVGFHNYDDVLIPVRGDLFVVGANESGKTTILDAVHLALSGELHMDWNAAANTTGAKPAGRSLQGIILRANLAGQATREGGSIAYAAVELRPAHSDGKPLCLVFGASAMDMHTQVHRWAVVVNATAAELPLTIDESDGVRRILDRDDFERRLGRPVFKSGRGIGDYRSTVAETLFAGRREFDEVAGLWRTAKSYKELARTARSIGDVIRRVLPAPDPEPFQKIAKGFRDIAEIEEDLNDLSRDVEQVERVRAVLIEVRESRESLRRYYYIQSIWRRNELLGALKTKSTEKESLADRITSLKTECDDLTTRISSAKERLATLRDSQGYKLVAHVEAEEARLRQAVERIERLSGPLPEMRIRLDSLRSDSERFRVAADTRLSFTRSELDDIAERLLDISLDVADDALELNSSIPPSVHSTYDRESVERGAAGVRSRLSRTLADLSVRIAAASKERQERQSALTATTEELQRVSRHVDLVPAIPRLEEVLTALGERQIEYKFLYQQLEWSADTTPQLKSAVEAAIGLSRLATLVVSPDDTIAARDIVLNVGCLLRILDAVSVPQRPFAKPGGHRIMDSVVVNDPRILAHLTATAGDVELVAEFPPEGADVVWYAEGGEGGERGARWRADVSEPCWIGTQQRRLVREARIATLTGTESRRRLELEESNARIESLQANQDVVTDALSRLNELQLPSSLDHCIAEFQRAHRAVEQLESDVVRRNQEILFESRQRDELIRFIAELKKQLENTDAHAVKNAVENLETQKNGWEEQLAICRGDYQAAGHKDKEIDERLGEIKLNLVTAEAQANSTRNSLAAVLADQHLSDLDHYVFESKRGGQLKRENLDDNIQTMNRKEAELLSRLCGSDGVMSDKLATRYGFRVDDDGALLFVRDRADLNIDEILNERREQERQMHESLNEKTRQLFETIFARDLTERLRTDLLQLRRTVNDINRKLEPLVFGHNRFQLTARPVAEHRRLVDLVERQAILDVESKEELRHYLEDRRDQLVVEGDVPAFLDYRFWFDYSFRLDHVVAESTPSMGSEHIVRASVGAQTTHNYLLLFALAGLLFDRSKAKLRLVMLDEPFHGLDAERKELLLRCGKQLGLDFAIATPDLDGTIQENAGDSTTVLVEKDEQERVSVLPFEWERIREQGELFPEARKEAVLGRTEAS